MEVENGNAITEKTVDALNQILEMMNQFAEAAKGSSVTSREQADMLRQVEQGIEQISSVVQSNFRICRGDFCYESAAFCTVG